MITFGASWAEPWFHGANSILGPLVGIALALATNSFNADRVCFAFFSKKRRIALDTKWELLQMDIAFHVGGEVTARMHT